MRRDELTVVTKVGCLQGADLEEAKAREAAGSPWPGVVKLPNAWHCISPEFVAHSVARSCERLGTIPDVVLVHNPEFILSEQLRQHGPGGVDHDAFYASLARCFDALEASGVPSYGVSANLIGCRWSVSGHPNDCEAVDLQRVVEAAPSRRCNVVQLPLNLLEPDACRHMAGVPSPAALAKELGFTVMAHRPIHAIPPYDAGFGVQRSSHISLRDSPSAMLPISALVRNTARDALAPFWPGAAQLPLQDLALLFALSAPDVDVVLNGMRSRAHVAHAAAMRSCAPLPPAAVKALTTAMATLVDDLMGKHGQVALRSATVGSATKHRGGGTGVQAVAGGGARRFMCTRIGSGFVDLPLVPVDGDTPVALKPARDGGPLAAVGASDRGMGLVYRAGRLAIDVAAAAAGSGVTRAPRDGRWLIKVQPPLDTSSDARGGMGRMTPATLLLHDETAEFCALVREEDQGHGALLRCALRSPHQVGYLWAEDIVDAQGKRVVRVHTHTVEMDGQRW